MNIATGPAAACIFFLSACTTTTLPLCPAIAANSLSPADPNRSVNYFVSSRAKDLDITILQTSWFSANFSGSYLAMAHFKNDYPLMLCAFDPSLQMTEIPQTFSSCMSNARSWISTIQSDHPEKIFDDTTQVYYGNCVRAVH